MLESGSSPHNTTTIESFAKLQWIRLTIHDRHFLVLNRLDQLNETFVPNTIRQTSVSIQDLHLIGDVLLKSLAVTLGFLEESYAFGNPLFFDQLVSNPCSVPLPLWDRNYILMAWDEGTFFAVRTYYRLVD